MFNFNIIITFKITSWTYHTIGLLIINTNFWGLGIDSIWIEIKWAFALY